MEVFYCVTSSKIAEKIIKVSIIEEMKHKIFDVLAKHEFELGLSIFGHLRRDHMLKFGIINKTLFQTLSMLSSEMLTSTCEFWLIFKFVMMLFSTGS